MAIPVRLSGREGTYQISLVVGHLGGADEVVLLAPPVAEATEEVVGQEAVDGVADDVDVDGFLDLKPDKGEVPNGSE